eukprot:gene9456-biopygen1885
MLPPRLLMMPPPLMMPLAHLSAHHLLTLTADDDGAGRHCWLHADARAGERHHTHETFLDWSKEFNGTNTNQRSRKKLGPLARELLAWPLRRQRVRTGS